MVFERMCGSTDLFFIISLKQSYYSKAQRVIHYSSAVFLPGWWLPSRVAMRQPCWVGNGMKIRVLLCRWITSSGKGLVFRASSITEQKNQVQMFGQSLMLWKIFMQWGPPSSRNKSKVDLTRDSYMDELSSWLGGCLKCPEHQEVQLGGSDSMFWLWSRCAVRCCLYMMEESHQGI